MTRAFGLAVIESCHDGTQSAHRCREVRTLVVHHSIRLGPHRGIRDFRSGRHPVSGHLIENLVTQMQGIWAAAQILRMFSWISASCSQPQSIARSPRAIITPRGLGSRIAVSSSLGKLRNTFRVSIFITTARSSRPWLCSSCCRTSISAGLETNE